jgi:hypothetical protein
VKIQGEITGLRELIARLETAGEVGGYTVDIVADARSAEVLGYHRSGTATMPQRDPVFVEPQELAAIARPIAKVLRQAVTEGSPPIRNAWQKAGAVMLDAVRSKFARGVGGTGTGVTAGRPFAPLTPEYAAAKRRNFGDRPILVATGRLLASLKARVRRT